MKILVYEWSFITKQDIYETFIKMGIEFDIFTTGLSPRTKDDKEAFREQLESSISDKKYDALFSVNFQDALSEVAHEKEILYICWTYDSPAIGGDRPCLHYETNRIFLFDSNEYQMYKKKKVPNLYYMPLAANVSRLSKIRIRPMDRAKYFSDISFVGTLYQSDMDKMFPLFDEYSAGFMAAVINTQLNLYGVDIIQELINDTVVESMCNEQVSEQLLKNINNNFLRDIEELKAWNFRAFLLKAVTNKERVLLLSLLGKYYRVKLYTNGTPDIPNVSVNGVIDYMDDMPFVFKCSRINLNITLRTIKHGMPQRIIDILGCHALALTNYQEDLMEYFRDGRDLLIYSSPEEALEKCKYYLKHENEAEKIRNNGYKIVKDQFSYEHQLRKIWELSGLKI